MLTGLLVDEPGGYKALVFDQSDRITEPISAADVADICLRALHESGARNKVGASCFACLSSWHFVCCGNKMRLLMLPPHLLSFWLLSHLVGGSIPGLDRSDT